MNIVATIFIIIGALALCVIALFMFAIWRAMMGRTRVNLSLDTTMHLHAKKMEQLMTSNDKMIQADNVLTDEVREVRRLLRDLIKKKDGNRE